MRRNMIPAAAALVCAVASPLAAQSTASSSTGTTAAGTRPADPIIERLWTLGMDSSRTVELAQALLDSIGPRLSGTPDQKRGNDWLVHMYSQWGIEARNEQVGTWRGWRRGISHIDMVSPRVRSLEGTMLGYSPGTGGRDVEAGTIILPRFADSTAFVQWLPNVRDRFVLVAPPQPTCRPQAEWEQHATPESRERMDSARAALQREWTGSSVRGTGYSLALGTGELGLRLEAAGAAGIITSRNKNQAGTYDVFETYNQRAPAVALSCEDYGLVFRTTEREQNARLSLRLDAELLGEQPIFNTIAVIPGSELPDEYVMMSAHFDSWDGASGATDNGTGTVVMMEAMRLLREVYPQPKRTILVGHWTAEEKGLVGSRAFTEDRPDVVAGLQALFNQDNGTGRIVRINAGGLPDAAAHMTDWLAQVPPYFSERINMQGAGSPSGGSSDDASFACHGAPAFGLGGLAWNYSAATWHTNRDTYDKVVFDDLRDNAVLTAMLVYLAAESPTTIARDRIDLGGGRDWPRCATAPRSTARRLR